MQPASLRRQGEKLRRARSGFLGIDKVTSVCTWELGLGLDVTVAEWMGNDAQGEVTHTDSVSTERIRSALDKQCRILYLARLIMDLQFFVSVCL